MDLAYVIIDSGTIKRKPCQDLQPESIPHICLVYYQTTNDSNSAIL